SRRLRSQIRESPDSPGRFTADMILWCAEKNSKARGFYEKKDFHIDGRTFTWKPLSGVNVPHVGYRLYRSAPPG
ncbi:hypothetical protein C3R29_15465, partial [Mycobacterium tuberculosis]